MFSSKIQRHANDKMWKRWWLFHATDFQSLMYPCFTICRFLGIFPYNINASTFEASKLHYVLSAVIICVCCALYLTIIHGIAISKIINFGDVTRNFGALSFYTFSGVIVIITHILSSPRMHLLQTILEISSKLPKESYQKLSRLIHVKDVFGTILIVVQLCIYFSKTEMFELTCSKVLILLFTMYLEMLIFQMNMLYINCVWVLKTCFKRINDNLIHVQRLVVNNMKLSVHRSIQQKNQFLLIELKTLKKQHLTVSKTVHMLNIIFSLQLLVTTVMSFSEITFELYSYVVRWKDGVFISLDWQFLDVLLASMTYYIMKIVLLVWVCETAKNQAKEISTTIHGVLNSTRDEQIKVELQLFSLQTLHCKNTFLTKGLTVDATLLTAMAGSVTTYMLIMIQFLITSHSCD
ncbi:PREDICTED: putative gustatory receptor 28b [Vollenhovia emeryi]|uniref:putative gustatory receptor 28b n=1 Tax=Vollenhovia emeryi TaxID=411798 RepID=UPI0005F469F5|nr:PREDICTED: putative gustatory receptor 28b [Vollenhovia emeryi]